MYNPATGELTYANGGHNTPLIVHADGSSTLLPLTGGIALGVMDDLPYQQRTITIAPGDTVILYTDGVTEAMNGAGEEFGVERLCEVFAAASPKNSREAVMAIFEAVNAFAGETPPV